MLRRIPAVKWAFTKLRPSPHGGSIDEAARAADDSSAIVADIAEAAPALDGNISTDPLHRDIEVATPVAEHDTAISVVAESPSAACANISISEDPSPDMPVIAEPVAVAEVPVSSVEVETEPAAPEPAVAEETPVTPVDIEIAPVDAPVLVVNDDPSTVVVLDVEPAVADDSFVALAESNVSTDQVSESGIDSAPSPSVTMEIEPVPDPAPVAVIVVEGPCADTPNVVTPIEPEPVLTAPASEVPSAPKPRAKAAEPPDRAALIRQRWAETGIRMWNPRLHGAGDATLNIQGRVELLPPAPGETMPRYDKLEFRMLGGQIVCEGVIVEAPAPAGHRSFTRLAEPRNQDRVREPERERQAALA
ncbi:hypothetical protein I3J27_27190 [Bradyrhizobium xenonodulans]|uniref:Uncharacterized protein n=1 Tax=Bradyrhizobium xenonodulans TaxID=2736875 RepID=A0ABY7MH50_9BRAD|nr:hypothetical protein [Bradyrhizobium xenonodulans]WBL76692.1 hypothetical protein I3J27_27190 [Bradyrhizobium xenonodulans]